ncbi:MAG TPA: anti-sigma factor antagonist [Sedimenticola sp.]|nr:anti-sigma factor antagonist [Sedimenticola sp.]
MTIESVIAEGGREVAIRVDGRFDFSTHQEFRKAYTRVDPQQAHYHIDLSHAEYIDSAALGMLLMLREKAGGEKARITISGCQGGVRQILEVSRFNQLFDIESMRQ